MSKRNPARTKYRKVQKGRNKGDAKGGNYLAFGDFAIQAIQRGKVSSEQLEAVRVAITRSLKRKGKLWLRVFPHKPVTKKPAETRMGKGKGSVEQWVAIAKPGTIICELAGVSATVAREAMSKAERKLGFRCRFVAREELEAY